MFGGLLFLLGFLLAVKNPMCPKMGNLFNVLMSRLCVGCVFVCECVCIIYACFERIGCMLLRARVCGVCVCVCVCVCGGGGGG